MKDMFNNLTAMMASLTSQMDLMDGGGRKKRKVTFQGRAVVLETSPPDGTSTATQHLPVSLQQLYGHLTGLTSTSAVPWTLPPPVPELISQEAPYKEGVPSLLRDVSEAVRT